MPPGDPPPIISAFREDADMMELVAAFVSALQERVQALETAADGNDVQELIRLAHQLRGASDSYGFDVIGEAAGALEAAGRQAVSTSDIQPQLGELITLCHRASADSGRDQDEAKS